ncbi:hypothetical protein KP509_26G062700 [Ceratopteris richardii]|uniref:Heterokaryon incompatibility domain-containing protein n=1 Tax=Ceratopteris richardii TaxID=49495 RepID=A0A8T2RMR8_CERRI|nr:hypothetical protein KP509_26G062700 [Ceratopteris richardii]KAH7297271.1 hypothetical protein KP509_26G062700 [Ceratopteris richardii]
MATTSQFPIRVIDVSETAKDDRRGVVFRKPIDWQFHVISHTWSKSVRDLSEEIANMIERETLKAEGLSRERDTLPSAEHLYGKFFEDADLSDRQSFQELKQLLCWLAGDGVKSVWMDALCINQTDDAEKEAEIANMGNYYRNSVACYVLPHGVGRYAPAVDPSLDDHLFGERDLPRWFYRVWTLQEWLLPPKVVFLMGDMKVQEIRLINAFILLSKSKWDIDSPSSELTGFCNCCVTSTDSITKKRRGMLHEYVVKQQRSHLLDSMKESDNPCSVCGSLPLITKAVSVYSAGKNRDVYFVAEEAYTEVLVILGMLGILSETLLMKFINLRKSTLSHGYKKDVCHVLDAWEVLYQSCGRDCSANNDEDRILGIKGLLGANSKTQVRTKLKLEQQVIVAARKHHGFARALCVLNKNIFMQEPGLSWAADLKRLSSPSVVSDLTTILFPHFPVSKYWPLMEIEKVSEAGLFLLARVGQARLCVSPKGSQKPCTSYMLSIPGGPAIPCQTRQTFNGTDDGDEDTIIFNSSRLPCKNAALVSSFDFDVWTIPLQTHSIIGKRSHAELLFMLCVGGDVTHLHNLAVLSSSTELLHKLCSWERQSCVISGYGLDVPEHCLRNAVVTYKPS